jgi:LysR family transcriptional regulator, glycine cleavage system transcriptional activator
MADRIPPLNWIRVFEVAARTNNFVAAAKLLSVSPGAVSRTVKELEKHLGIRLFQRLKRGIRLTSEGQAYAQSVAPALAQIAEASTRVGRQARANLLQITAMPALAERWLVPRLGDFQRRFPNTSVELSADASVVDLNNSDFDVALRYSDGRFTFPAFVKLFDDEVFPVAAPSALKNAGMARYSDIFKLAALQDRSWASDWGTWLGAAGVPAPRDWQSTSFTLYSMALSAAIAGQGIIIAHTRLVESELQKGTLVELFDLRVKLDKGFYAVMNPSRTPSPAANAFVSWIASQAQ